MNLQSFEGVLIVSKIVCHQLASRWVSYGLFHARLERLRFKSLIMATKFSCCTSFATIPRIDVTNCASLFIWTFSKKDCYRCLRRSFDIRTYLRIFCHCFDFWLSTKAMRASKLAIRVLTIFSYSLKQIDLRPRLAGTFFAYFFWDTVLSLSYAI